ncbi:hypothetical protein [Chryseosolibacter indicus]|uniref:Lipoprotein n=1 Tax=Chryseosolibacter indicus TaxID=2782351 RepID=A0ABS5VWB7_9BACT|nr:hypothetical protein [Chryseosolibacter indicus]MBT1704296.1 hypothetical protein [Chryseosolibacter indicus]
MLRRIKNPLILLLIFISCAPPKYQVVNDSTYYDTNDARNPRKTVLLSIKQFTDSEDLINLIKKRDWLTIEKRLREQNRPALFIKSIRHLIEKKYAESYKLLNALPEDAYACQVLLLKIDCLYELKSDTTSFRNQYQKVYDCTPDPKVKSIVKDHYRFVKYGL